MRKRLGTLWSKFHEYAQKYWLLWIIVALLEDRVRDYANDALDSFAIQYEWAINLKAGVLWFDSIGLGFIGNLIILTLLGILLLSYWDTSRDAQSPSPAKNKVARETPPIDWDRRREEWERERQPPDLTGDVVTEAIAYLKRIPIKAPIKIVSTQEHIKWAKVLANIFRLSGYEVMSDQEGTDDIFLEGTDAIFLAKVKHERLVVRYPEEEKQKSFENLARYGDYLFVIQAQVFRSFNYVKVPSSSGIDYIQIEIKGAP